MRSRPITTTKSTSVSRAHLLGVRLQRARDGSAVCTRLDDGGGVGDRLGHRQRAGRVAWSRASRRASYAASASDGDHEHEHDADLQQQDLPRHRRLPGPRADHARIVPQRRLHSDRDHNDHNGDGAHSGPDSGRQPGCHPDGPGGSMSATTNTSASTRPAAPRNRTHYLYVAVIVAVGLGIAVGLLAPSFAVELKPLGQAFVALIKMMIQPVIFCTIVLGVGSVAQRRPGRQGRRARARLLRHDVDVRAGDRPARRQHPAPGRRAAAHRRARGRRPGAGRGRTRQHHRVPARDHPDSMFSSLTSGEVLQTLLVALLVGFALQQMGRAGEPVLRGVGHVQRLVFRVLAMIMWAAPVGAFGAIAAVVGETGVDALKSLAVLMFGFYVTCALFVFVVLGTLLKLTTGVNIFAPAPLPGPRVPADRVDVLVGVGAAAADREDGARRRGQGDRRRRRADRLLVQPRRHRDLPDDGVAVHRRGAGRPADASASRSRCCCS